MYVLHTLKAKKLPILRQSLPIFKHNKNSTRFHVMFFHLENMHPRKYVALLVFALLVLADITHEKTNFSKHVH